MHLVMLMIGVVLGSATPTAAPASWRVVPPTVVLPAHPTTCGGALSVSDVVEAIVRTQQMIRRAM